MRIIAVCNQKGGVGKTTTTVSLAACLVEAGQRVLLVDMDPQADATAWLSEETDAPNLLEVLLGKIPLKDAVIPSRLDGLDILPSSNHLAMANVQLASRMARETALKRALETIAPNTWDVVLIDCPPGLELLSINALVAAEEVVIPVSTEAMPLRGLARIWNAVQEVRDLGLNPTLEVTGVLACMWQPRPTLHQQVLSEMRAELGDLMFQSVIQQNIRLSEAPDHGLPINLYSPTSSGAANYNAASQELLQRGGGRRAA